MRHKGIVPTTHDYIGGHPWVSLNHLIGKVVLALWEAGAGAFCFVNAVAVSVESGRGAICNASSGHKASGLPCCLRPIKDGLQLGSGNRAVGIAVVYLIVIAYSESLRLDSREDRSCCRVSVGNLVVYIISLRPNERDIQILIYQ